MQTMSHEALIAALGGYRRLAERVRTHPSTTFRWAERGIPQRRWPQVLRIAQEAQVPVTLEDLARTHPLAAREVG